MIVYAFEFCDCIYESSMATVSLHVTKRGAWKAMNSYINEHWQRDQDQRTKYGKNPGIQPLFACAWRVQSIEVQP